jgi:TRAP-type C4-dicarboxylate transport system permease large subunit
VEGDHRIVEIVEAAVGLIVGDVAVVGVVAGVEVGGVVGAAQTVSRIIAVVIGDEDEGEDLDQTAVVGAVQTVGRIL